MFWYLGQYSQEEPAVGDHLFDLSLVTGDDGHDVGDEMSYSGEKERKGIKRKRKKRDEEKQKERQRQRFGSA